jgi:hypothetical protein
MRPLCSATKYVVSSLPSLRAISCLIASSGYG